MVKRYRKSHEVVVDSIVGNGNHLISFKAGPNVDGLYFLSYDKHDDAEFVLSTKEQDAKVVVDKVTLISNGTIRTVNSEENEAYSKFVRAYLAFDQQFYPLANQRFPRLSPKIISSLREQGSHLLNIQSSLNQQLDELMASYPGTFTASVLCPLVRRKTMYDETEYETYISFLHDHFWDGCFAGQDKILNHFMLNECIKNYFRYFVGKTEMDIKNGVDILIGASAENPSVNLYVRSFLIQNFLRSHANALSQYILKTSSEAGTCDLGLSPEDAKLLENLETPLDSGDAIPFVSLPNLEQKPVPLLDVLSKAELTLVVFWSAKCGHCQDELPRIQRVYDVYHQQGFQIYSINLDENKFDWREYLEFHPNDWVNVTDTGPVATSETVKNFQVIKTPTVFLVNSKGIIVARDLFGSDLPDFVESYLADK